MVDASGQVVVQSNVTHVPEVLWGSLPLLSPSLVPLQLTVQAQGSKVIALSSVVTGKEVESKAITLRRELEGDIYSILYLFPFLLFYISDSLLSFHIPITAIAAHKVIPIKSREKNYTEKNNYKPNVTIPNVSHPVTLPLSFCVGSKSICDCGLKCTFSFTAFNSL